MGLIIFFIGLVAGMVAGAAIVLVWGYRRFAHNRAEAERYKGLWMEATQLLGEAGQLTAEQILAIGGVALSPETNASQKLPMKPGFSHDRAAIEIMRAKRGLPPADNLNGMFSADVREVEEARLKYRHKQKPDHA